MDDRADVANPLARYLTMSVAAVHVHCICLNHRRLRNVHVQISRWQRTLSRCDRQHTGWQLPLRSRLVNFISARRAPGGQEQASDVTATRIKLQATKSVVGNCTPAKTPSAGGPPKQHTPTHDQLSCIAIFEVSVLICCIWLFMPSRVVDFTRQTRGPQICMAT